MVFIDSACLYSDDKTNSSTVQLDFLTFYDHIVEQKVISYSMDALARDSDLNPMSKNLLINPSCCDWACQRGALMPP